MTRSPEPEQVRYACAILADRQQRLWLELRPGSASNAPNQLTCFGGEVEPGESPEHAIARELREELGLEVPGLRVALTLYVGGRATAAYFTTDHPLAGVEQVRVLPGRGLAIVAMEDFERFPVSAWHVAALRAWREGRREARIEA